MYILDISSILDIKTIPHWLFIIVIMCIVLSFTFAFITKDRFSKRQIQAATSLMGDMGYKLQTINVELQNLKATKEQWYELQKKVTACPSEMIQIRKEFIDYLTFRIEAINIIEQKVHPSTEDLKVLSKTKITVGEINAFYNIMYPNTFQEILNFYMKLKSWTETSNDDSLYKAIEKEFEMIQISGEMMYFNFLELVAVMPQLVKSDFYEKLVPFLTQFPAVKMLSEVEAKSMADRAYNQYQGLITEFASIIGSEEFNIRLLEKDIRDLKLKKK